MKRWVLALGLVVACGKSDGNGAGSAQAPAAGKVDTPSPEEQQVRSAELHKDAAMKRAEEARARLDKIERELEELETKVTAAVQQTLDAKTDAERSAAKETLQQLQAAEAALKSRAAHAQADAAAAARMQGVQISKQCLDNPLAAGCN